MALALLTSDLAVTALVWFGAYALRFACWPAPAGVPGLEAVAAALPQVLLLAVVAYRVCGMYHVHRLRRLWAEAGTVAMASGLLFLLTTTVTFYFRELYESRLALGLFLLLNALALTASRRGLWWFFATLRRRGSWQGKGVLVGSGRMARLALETLTTNRWAGTQIIGYVDRPGQRAAGSLPRLGDIDELPEVIARHGAEYVFVALPLERYGELPHVYTALSDVLVEVHLVADVPSISGMSFRTVELDGVPIVSLRENPHFAWHRLAKRAIDLGVGAAAIVALSPVMLLVALLVKLSSRGPVFYRQPRTGLNGRTFQMLKFRSMRVDAERATGPVWAVRGDDRCTTLGRLLRRWSLDELPQLFNVLKGDMSLVGPRPERGVFVEQFRRQIPNYAQRHQVKAGITGWAQVNGWRGNTSLRRRVECDLYYICNWSLWLDLKILLLTPLRGIWHRNAM
jgi:exopolysaccharide biosynthesis polyprenyl glycosylphosphotransferase